MLDSCPVCLTRTNLSLSPFLPIYSQRLRIPASLYQYTGASVAEVSVPPASKSIRVISNRYSVINLFSILDCRMKSEEL
jgi:hypothetical protein